MLENFVDGGRVVGKLLSGNKSTNSILEHNTQADGRAYALLRVHVVERHKRIIIEELSAVRAREAVSDLLGFAKLVVLVVDGLFVSNSLDSAVHKFAYKSGDYGVRGEVGMIPCV